MTRILIVDDDPFTHTSIKSALKKGRYEILDAEDGDEGLEILLEQNPDIVLLDLKMPYMTGIEFLQDAPLVFGLDTCVIVLTGAGEDEHVKKCYQLGASAFVRKPFNPYELKGIVGSVAASQAARKKLADKERYLSTLYKSISDALIVFNQDALVVSANSSAGNLFGVPAVELVNQPFSTLFNSFDLDTVHLSDIVRKGGQILVAKKKDGSVTPVDMTTGAVESESGDPHFACLIHDESEKVSRISRLEMKVNHLTEVTRNRTARILDIASGLKESVDTIKREIESVSETVDIRYYDFIDDIQKNAIYASANVGQLILMAKQELLEIEQPEMGVKLNGRVLLAVDDVNLASQIKEWLLSRDLHVIEVDDGSVAVQRSGLHRIDIMIMSEHVDGMPAIDILDLMAEVDNRTPTIWLGESTEAALPSHVNILPLDMTEEELIASIANLLKGINLTRVDDDHQKGHGYTDVFAAIVDASLSDLSIALEQENNEQIKIAAGTLAMSADSFGFHKIADLAIALEASGISADKQKMQDALSLLKASCVEYLT